MLLDGFFETLNDFKEIIKKKFRGIYQNSSLYEKKISKTFDNEFIYKPSPHLLSSIIKYQNKKYKIEDFELETVWNNQIKLKDFKKLIFDGGFVLAHWDGTEQTEELIKKETKATIRCIPFESNEQGLCIVSGKKSKGMVFFARSY